MPDSRDDEIAVRERAPQPVLSGRRTVQIAQLTAAQGEALNALWNHLQRHDIEPAGAPFVRFHTFGDAETDVETGIPVAEAAAGEDPVAGGELPGGRLVSSWHLGSHDRLGEAYARLEAWLQEHGHQRRGSGWEVYHWFDLKQEPDISSWPDPATWRTQLVQPIT